MMTWNELMNILLTWMIELKLTATSRACQRILVINLQTYYNNLNMKMQSNNIILLMLDYYSKKLLKLQN